MSGTFGRNFFNPDFEWGFRTVRISSKQLCVALQPRWLIQLQVLRFHARHRRSGTWGAYGMKLMKSDQY